MKKIIIAGIALCLLIPATSARAEDNRTEERVGFGAGMIIGAIAGGPAAAIVAAVTGAWLGDKVNEADKVPELTIALDDSQLRLTQIKHQLAQSNNQLDNAKLMLQEQTVVQQKVSEQKNAISGLTMDVMFRTNSSELSQSGVDKLLPVALMLEQFPEFTVELIGHGDVLGSVAANQLVAEERALRVKQSLVNAGIESNRIQIVNLGKSEAQAELDDVEGRAQERRVRLQLLQQGVKSKPVLAQN